MTPSSTRYGAQFGPDITFLGLPAVDVADASAAYPLSTWRMRHLGFGRVSMIHFDAHADTGDIEFGSLYGHGQPMHRLIESGALRGVASCKSGCAATGPVLRR